MEEDKDISSPPFEDGSGPLDEAASLVHVSHEIEDMASTAPKLEQVLVPARNPDDLDPSVAGSATETAASPAFLKSQTLPCVAVDTEEMRLLCRLLSEHDHRRSEGNEGNHSQDDIEFTCMTLMTGPVEQGTQATPLVLQDHLRNRLAKIGAESLPEARLCRIWMMGCCDDWPADAVASIASLAASDLWEPVQALAFRALANLGRQDLLANLLSQAAPTSLSRADAMLETPLVSTGDASLCFSSVPLIGPIPELAASWQAVMEVERRLAAGDTTQGMKDVLRRAMQVPSPSHQFRYSLLEGQRLAGRAAAAAVRYCLARHQDDEGILSDPACAYLPTWEREFLKALTQWFAKDMRGAEISLRTAAQHSINKSCVHLALASLLASGNPAEALSELQSCTQTREVLVSRAALLVRMGRPTEAQSCIDQTRGGSCPSEPSRYTWSTARRRLHWQEHAIRAGLAELRGDWKEASSSWRQACKLYSRKSLDMGRQLFAAQQELRSLQNHHGWRRGEVERWIQRAQVEIGQIPLKDTEAFFRGMANVEDHADLAQKDLVSLLHRRNWIAAESRIGGFRLLALGDALARLGKPSESIQAYQTASPHNSDAKQRLAIAKMWAKVEQGACENEIIAAREAIAMTPDNGWLELITALGLLIAGRPDKARLYLEAATVLSTPAKLHRCLVALACACAGEKVDLSKKDLSGLSLSRRTLSLLRMLAKEEPSVGLLESVMIECGEKWIENCLLNPCCLAQRAIAELCDANRWDMAQTTAQQIQRTGEPWATTLRQLIAIRRSLHRVIKHIDQAPEAIAELQSVRQVTGHCSSVPKTGGR